VPLVRGSKVISRPEKEIIKEAENLTGAGYRELVITGINLGLYGRPDTHALASLLKKLTEIKNMGRIRLSSIGPKELSDEIINFSAENKDKICPHFHLSLQSGDEKVLKLMNRNYTPDEYTAKTDYIIQRIPEAAITTDIIAGFPGESVQEFKNTCDFIREAPITRLHVFPYSDRPGTKAEQMHGKITEQEKKRRVKILIGIGKAKEKEFAEKNTGRKMTALIEDNPKAGYFAGYTENYIRVNIKETDKSKKLVNRLVQVMITEMKDGKVYAEIV
jgi:threonylcarbamoyladenosine tRNA methylthiotransferase MtaB